MTVIDCATASWHALQTLDACHISREFPTASLQFPEQDRLTMQLRVFGDCMAWLAEGWLKLVMPFKCLPETLLPGQLKAADAPYPSTTRDQ